MSEILDRVHRPSRSALIRVETRLRLASARGALALVVLAGSCIAATSPSVAPPSLGQAPPEWAAGSPWPGHNHDLANTRDTTHTPIDSHTVATLKPIWRFTFPTTSAFGAFASTPIVVGKTIYLQDLNSDVYALELATGTVKWKRAFTDPNLGPNGVAYGWGRLYGATGSSAFALDPRSGHLLWSRPLVRNASTGIDIAPQLYDHTVLLSTKPGNLGSPYAAGSFGVVWALDARTGATKWTFNTVSDGARLWGMPAVNSGGGLWYPPAVDSDGRVFISIGNPAPFPGTIDYPNGASRPGPDLYTDSIVALDGRTGKVLWYRQPVPHDVRDYDLEDSPILTRALIAGNETELVLAAGKMGKVFAYRAADGNRLWTATLGKHQHDNGPLPRKPTLVYPGDLGGIETPMALANNRLFVPWVDAPTLETATGFVSGLSAGVSNHDRGGIAAIDATNGRVLWQRHLPSPDLGAATVANDVVFTSTYAGITYALDAQTGHTLWTARAKAGINSFPAIAGSTLIVGAGAPSTNTQPQLTAYRLTK